MLLLLNFKVTFMHKSVCSMNNKNPETEVGLQLEGPKSKVVSHWLSLLPQSEMAILPPGITERHYVCELSPSILYSSPGLGLKVCTTGIKDMYCLVC